MKVVQGMRNGEEEVNQGAGHQGMRRVSGGDSVFGMSNTALFILLLIKLAASYPPTYL